MAGPFEGVRVLDVTSGIPGAMASMFLADFGAEVIRIEPPGGGRLAKLRGALCWNRNKLRLEADVETPSGHAAVHELLPGADVALFDHGPRDLSRFGFDATTLRASNPALLHCWLPPYGLAEPWANLPANDGLLSALTGVAQLQAGADGQPVRLVTPQASYAHGVLGAFAVAAGLLERARTGAAHPVTVTGLHAVSAIEGGGLVKSAGSTRLFARGAAANYRLYQCGDGGWLFFGALTPEFFLRALEAMGLVELMVHPAVGGDFANVLQPPGSEVAIELLGARFRQASCGYWEERLRAAGVPVARVGSREEWFRGETVAVHEMRLVMPHPEVGEVEMPGIPLEMTETPGAVGGFIAPSGGWGWMPRPESAASSPAEPAGRDLPLAGIRVLDLGGFVAGPFAPALLAAFGADVIKIEPPVGDPFRTYGLTFAAHNRGKRSVVLDLKTPAGLGAFERLVALADVMVDNFRPGVRDRLGIGDDRLRELNPRLIGCSVTGYGGKGPFANDPGFDPILQAQGGLMRAQGGDGPPVFHQVAVNDTAAALTLAFGAAAGLVNRERTGKGQFVRTNLAAQAVMFQSGELTTFPGTPAAPLGAPVFLGSRALDRLYRCADGWLSVSCGTTAEAAALLSVLFGNEPAASNHPLAESADSPFARAIADALSPRSRMGTVAALLAAGVPCVPVLTRDEALEDASLAADGFIDEFEDAALGRVTGVARFAEWGGLPRVPRGPAPALGQHTGEVLSEAGPG